VTVAADAFGDVLFYRSLYFFDNGGGDIQWCFPTMALAAMINLDLVLCDFLGCGGGHVRFLCEGGVG